MIADIIVDAYATWQPGRDVRLFIAPPRIGFAPDLVESDPGGKVAVAYARPRFGALRGPETLQRALRDDLSSLPVTLVAEEDEDVRPGVTARAYVARLPHR